MKRNGKINSLLFFSTVAIAGIYGALTADNKIFFMQALLHLLL